MDHRPRVGRERSERTEARILEAAFGVFAEMGPDAPKIDDFVQAAGISRGTFYNHFESVEQLLAATAEWTTRELMERIETTLEETEGPVLRFGLGLRLFLTKAHADPVWCRFVARTWKVGGRELPLRDLEEGVRLGLFRTPSLAAAQDLLFGVLREALLRLGDGRTPPTHGAHVTELCLRALGIDARRIEAVLNHPLPPFAKDEATS